MLGSEMLQSPCVNTETHDLPSILGMLAQQKLVIGILTLETVPQRFGIDSAHTDSIAQPVSVFTQRARRHPSGSDRLRPGPGRMSPPCVAFDMGG